VTEPYLVLHGLLDTSASGEQGSVSDPKDLLEQALLLNEASAAERILRAAASEYSALGAVEGLIVPVLESIGRKW
jgi:hypothetical protein